MMTTQQFLNTININDKPRAYLMCGVAGAGKTTIANKLSEKGFKRFSIDEFIRLRFGTYGIDYEADQYAELKAEAEHQLELEIITALKQKLPLVIDYSFWKRSNREKYKLLIEG